jgi:gliding motility-associatede transport system auxiliary component
VLNPTEKRVYFLAGHGEKDPTNTERGGYSAIIDALRQDNYQWEKLIIAQTNAIPENATVLILAGPKTDLIEGEAELIRQYLSVKHGKLLVLLDPADDFKKPAPLPRIEALVKDWGINATPSVVVDVSGLTKIATIPVAAPPYPNHPITSRFQLITMFPVARAVIPAMGAPADRTAQSFIQTAARTWAETNLASLDPPDNLAPEPDKGDITGPVSIAAAVAVPAQVDPAQKKEGVEQRPPETRVAVIGDSDFIGNGYLGIEGNRDLFLNTVNWLAQQESLIAIRPKEASDRRLTMTANHVMGVLWMSLLIVPALVIGAGVFAWWRRRER